MCSPGAMMATQGASAASSAVGAYYSAQGQQNALRQQADLAEIQAQRTLQSGERDVQRSRLQTASLKGTQRAGMAANGIDVGVGSAAQVLTSTDVMGEIDANTIEANAVRSAWGYRTEATMKRGSASAINPAMAGATSILGGAGKVATSWYRLQGNSGSIGRND